MNIRIFLRKWKSGFNDEISSRSLLINSQAQAVSHNECYTNLKRKLNKRAAKISVSNIGPRQQPVLLCSSFPKIMNTTIIPNPSNKLVDIILVPLFSLDLIGFWNVVNLVTTGTNDSSKDNFLPPLYCSNYVLELVYKNIITIKNKVFYNNYPILRRYLQWQF